MNLLRMSKSDLICLIDEHHSVKSAHHYCGREAQDGNWGKSCMACATFQTALDARTKRAKRR